jgi:hypothetical protein
VFAAEKQVGDEIILQPDIVQGVRKKDAAFGEYHVAAPTKKIQQFRRSNVQYRFDTAKLKSMNSFSLK